MGNKIIRSICYFARQYDESQEDKISKISSKLQNKGYEIQTQRICIQDKNFISSKDSVKNPETLLSLGSLNYEEIKSHFDEFCNFPNLSINMDLTKIEIQQKHVEILWDIISKAPHKTFEFTYVFNNTNSSPYFPSANYEKNGFSIGLQPTDLSVGCDSLQQWLGNMKNIWIEINELFNDHKDFLGIDSSIAPIFTDQGSLVNFIKRLGYDFSQSCITDTYTQITRFIKEENPNPVGLCGLMFPCLEDFDLADEYEKGNFSIERNIYLSLHSGLGIDTYPIGIDEDRKTILEILKLMQALSNKYKKPLSVRFVSDGKSKIGQKSDFQNQYLKDVIIKKI